MSGHVPKLVCHIDLKVLAIPDYHSRQAGLQNLRPVRRLLLNLYHLKSEKTAIVMKFITVSADVMTSQYFGSHFPILGACGTRAVADFAFCANNQELQAASHGFVEAEVAPDRYEDYPRWFIINRNVFGWA